MQELLHGSVSPPTLVKDQSSSTRVNNNHPASSIACIIHHINKASAKHLLNTYHHTQSHHDPLQNNPSFELLTIYVAPPCTEANRNHLSIMIHDGANYFLTVANYKPRERPCQSNGYFPPRSVRQYLQRERERARAKGPHHHQKFIGMKHFCKANSKTKNTQNNQASLPPSILPR